jgi:hypothetical protein
MRWPPKIGEVLPRAEEAWYDQSKFDDWIFAAQGHGLEWEQVFEVGPKEREQVWEAIAGAALGATIVEVRDHPRFGTTCGIETGLSIGERTAPVTISWHYASQDAAPRLVTAYPTL